MPHRVDWKLKNTNRKFYFPNTLSFENGGEAATLKTLVSHPSLYNILLVLLLDVVLILLPLLAVIDFNISCPIEFAIV